MQVEDKCACIILVVFYYGGLTKPLGLPAASEVYIFLF